MPICKEHGQVYGEGGKCRVCAGEKPVHAPGYAMPTAEQLEKRLQALEARVTELEK